MDVTSPVPVDVDDTADTVTPSAAVSCAGVEALNVCAADAALVPPDADRKKTFAMSEPDVYDTENELADTLRYVASPLSKFVRQVELAEASVTPDMVSVTLNTAEEGAAVEGAPDGDAVGIRVGPV